MATGGPNDKALTKLLTNCRASENRLKTSLTNVKSLLPEDAVNDLDITRAINLTYSSNISNVSRNNDQQVTTPTASGVKNGRKESQTSTTSVWSGEGSQQVPAMETVPESRSTAAEIAQSVLRKVRGNRQDPFFIYGEFKKLRTRVEHFNEQAAYLQEAAGEGSGLFDRVQAKIEHFNVTFEAIQIASDDMIWMMCSRHGMPLPGTPDRWAHRQPLSQLQIIPNRSPRATSTPSGHQSEGDDDILSERDVNISLNSVLNTRESPGVVSGIRPHQGLTSSILDIPLDEPNDRQSVQRPPLVPNAFHQGPSNSILDIPFNERNDRQSVQRPPIVPTGFIVDHSAVGSQRQDRSQIVELVQTSGQLVNLGAETQPTWSVQASGGQHIPPSTPSLGCTQLGRVQGHKSLGDQQYISPLQDLGSLQRGNKERHLALSDQQRGQHIVTLLPGAQHDRVAGHPNIEDQLRSRVQSPIQQDIEKAQAFSSFKITLRTVRDIVSVVRQSIDSNTGQKDSFINSLVMQLDVAVGKLEVEFELQYQRLCEADPDNFLEYTKSYEEFQARWGGEILTTRVQLLSMSSRITPVVIDKEQMQERKVDYRYLPKLKELTFSGNVEDWPEFRRNWQARFSNVPDDVQIQYLKRALPSKDQ